MLFDYLTLKIIWWVFVGVLLIGFALLGGFDLGIGALLPFVARTDPQRRVMLNTIGPTWEGNQVAASTTSIRGVCDGYPLIVGSNSAILLRCDTSPDSDGDGAGDHVERHRGWSLLHRARPVVLLGCR